MYESPYRHLLKEHFKTCVIYQLKYNYIHIRCVCINNMTLENHKVVAEISIIPLGKNHSTDAMQTSISREIACALKAIKKLKGVKVNLNAMGTEIETNNIQDILKSIEVAHQAIKDLGIKRIISTIRIDERLDKMETLEERVDSVYEKMAKP